MFMILVTGATGMTGQFVVQELLNRGHKVRALARTASAGRLPAGVEIAVGDLGDFASLARAAADVSGIIHTACTFTNAMLDVAAMGALLDAWTHGSFVFVSSLDVYGAPQQIPIGEDHPLVESAGSYDQGDLTGYAYGKVLCERMLAAKAAVQGRSDYASLRAPHIWGPHPKARQRLVHARMEAGEPLLLPGADEDEWSQYGDAWIDVRDLARLAVDCVEGPPGTEMNVLSGHFVWHDLLAEVIRLSGSRSTIEHRPLAEIADEPFGTSFYAQRWRFSDVRLKQTLSYTPHYNLPQTLADTIAS
jgi:nucleoside-diphosphate-sugar epimerase